MLKLTDKEAGKMLYILRAAQEEFNTLTPRMPNPYRQNVKGCADLCKEGMKIIQDVISRGDDVEFKDK